jgi:hypothetical protein
MDNIKPTSTLFLKIRRDAPSSTLSENYGRTGGYYGDEDEETSGYSAVMIYVQLGLQDYYDVILEAVRLVLKVQLGYRKKYPIVISAFGKGIEFIHEGKYFEMGYMNDKFSDTKIAEKLKLLSSKDTSETPAVIHKLFPKTDMRSLYGGKTRFEQNDFMVIIAKKGELIFANELELLLKQSVKKRILVLEIDEKNVFWNYKIFDFKFFNNNN